MASRTRRRGQITAVGERIARIRQERKLSRRIVAELAGIHENTLKKIENGDGNPTLSVLLGIAEALGVKVHDLVCKA